MRHWACRAWLGCVFLVWCGLALANGAAFTARSTDYPHPLWPNLDVTVTEIEKHDRWSAFSIEEKKGLQGAGATSRFFACVSARLAKDRGLPYFAGLVGSSGRANNPNIDQRYVWLVAFPVRPIEDIPEIIADIGDRFGKPLKGEFGVSVDDFLKMLSCPMFGRGGTT